MRTLKVATTSTKLENIKYNFYVIDVETTKLEPMPENFVFAIIYGFNHAPIKLNSPEEVIKELENPKYLGKYIFAHNAEFDLTAIFGNIIQNIDNSSIFNGKFISSKHYPKDSKKFITFGDSLNIFKASVAQIGDMLGSAKHDNTKIKLGGLTKENVTQEDIDYCIQDCKIVFQALQRIFERVGAIKLTLASLSMYNYRSLYLKKNVDFSEGVDEFYESYYGGRTEAFHIGNVNAKLYDINSMYSKAMTDVEFPDIKNLHKETKVDVKYLLYALPLYEGLAKVTVHHKETYFGYLPCRMQINKAFKLCFPVGIFTTTVNFNELRFAVEQGVVEILQVHYIVRGNPVESPFKEFIFKNYEGKSSATNPLDRRIYKDIMNSLYGRFGMKMKMTTTYYEQLPIDLLNELQDTEAKFELRMFNEKRSDCYVITESSQMKANFFSIPTYASYITSYARVLLLKHMVMNEGNQVVYCDTDSIALQGNFIGPVSDEMGEFKLENKILTEVRGLKNYTYTNGDGKTHDVIKGISRSSEKKEVAGSIYPIYETPKYYKTKEAITRNKEAGKAYTKTTELKHVYDKRLILPGGFTKPIKL